MRLKTKKKIKSSSLWSELTIFLEEIFPHIFVGIIVFMVFIISIDIYEYITTEIWWIHDSLNYAYTGLFLMCLILIATTINWEIFLKKKSFVSLILLFFPLILIFHKEYMNFYNNLQSYPKVKNISSNSGIQGCLVKINGRNFGGAHEKGRVLIGDEVMNIKKWSDKEIIFEVPVFSKPGKHNILIEAKNSINTDFTYEFKAS